MGGRDSDSGVKKGSDGDEGDSLTYILNYGRDEESDRNHSVTLNQINDMAESQVSLIQRDDRSNN